MRYLVVLALVLGVSSTAHAFHEIRSFTRTANTGGGASSYYTGSPRFKGYDCSMCHNDGPETIRIGLSSAPGGITAGEYEPGVRYTIDVTLVGEHRGLESAFNPNTFVLEVVSQTGEAVGALSVPLGTPMETTDEGRIAVAEGFGNGETEWRLFWEAPATGAPATLYIAMLDGDGATNSERRTIDALNDDVVVGNIDLCPAGARCDFDEDPPEERSRVQCSAAGAGSRELGGVVGLAVLGVLCRRRRPQR